MQIIIVGKGSHAKNRLEVVSVNAHDRVSRVKWLEGVWISSVSRAKGIKEDTILSFLRQAARHAEAVLLNEHRIS